MDTPSPALLDRILPYLGRLCLAYWAAYAGVASSFQVTSGHFGLRDLNPLLPVLVCTSHPLFTIIALPPMGFALLYVVRRWPWWLATGIAVYCSCALTWILSSLTSAGA